MGGNAKINGEGSEPITINMRKQRRHDIDRMLHSVNRHTKNELFGYGAPSLANGSAYSGSTAHMMNKELKDEDLRKFKKSFGDVDVMIPKEHEQKLTDALQPGTKHGKFTVVGARKIGPSVSAIMKHDDGKNHQVDFEFKNFDKDNQEPDAFSKFSQNASLDDMKLGIKGAAHKTLVSALTSRKGETGVVERIKGGKSSMSAPQHIRATTFSQAYGTRNKHIPALDAEGKQKVHNGHKVYTEMQSDGAKYETDLSKIHEQLFGKPSNDSDVEKMHSFVGTAKLMKKHLEPHEVRSVINDYAKRLYDKRAATHMSGDPTKDNQLKVDSLRELRKHFPEHFDKLMYDTVSKYRENYYDKTKQQLKESTEKTIHIALAAGRFTGPTKQHGILIEQVFAQPADYHYIYVMGPKTIAETTDRDPLTITEKVAQLRRLYPEHADSFIAGDTDRTKSPLQAMVNSWHLHEQEGENLELTVVAGDGETGITGKDAGGSALVYEEMANRINGTTFSDGTYRMNYESINIIRNPRGKESGTLLREAARDNNFDLFKETLHPRISNFRARQLMNELHTRLVPDDGSDLIGENYEVIEYGAKDLNLPVEVIEKLLEGATSVEQMFDRLHSTSTKLYLNEDFADLTNNVPDTFVIMYNPDKLYYHVERLHLVPGLTINEQPVVADRLKQGFIITSTHTDTLNPQMIQGGTKYQMRKYRRQIDD